MLLGQKGIKMIIRDKDKRYQTNFIKIRSASEYVNAISFSRKMVLNSLSLSQNIVYFNDYKISCKDEQYAEKLFNYLDEYFNDYRREKLERILNGK